MTSQSGRNRLIVAAAVLLCGLAAVLAYALGGSSGTEDRAGPAGATARPSGTPVRSPAGPRPSAAATAAATVWVPADPALADVCRTRLPAQAGDTLALIARGGPYPYRSDGIVFENRESRLPRKASGYYHEYTVVTPGSTDRGTRRIVTGGAGEQYWTADHYASFQEIDARC